MVQILFQPVEKVMIGLIRLPERDGCKPRFGRLTEEASGCAKKPSLVGFVDLALLKHFPDRRDRKTGSVHQVAEFISELDHFIRCLGYVITQANLSQF